MFLFSNYLSFKCYDEWCPRGPQVEIILGVVSTEVVRLCKGSVLPQSLRNGGVNHIRW